MIFTLDIKPEDGKKLVRDKYSLADQAEAFPTWYKRWTETLKRKPEEFPRLSIPICTWQNKLFETSPLGVGGICASTANIIGPAGEWWFNYPGDIGYGNYEFGGTFGYYGPASGAGTTNIMCWWEEWMGKDDQDVFRSAMYGDNTALGYSESFSFRRVRILGRRAQQVAPDPKVKSHGVVFYDCGETSKIDQVYVEGFNNSGIVFERGTPITAGCITAFNNCEAGILLKGCAGATGTFQMVSGDDNAALVEMVAGGGREAGGQFDFNFKDENAITKDRFPIRHQRLLRLRGQFGVAASIARASNGVRLENLIEVDARLQDGSMQESNLVVNSLSTFNCDNVVYDIANGWKAKSRGDFRCHSFQYTSAGGGKMFNPFFVFDGAPNALHDKPTPEPEPTPDKLKLKQEFLVPTKATDKITAQADLGKVSKVVLNKFKLLVVPTGQQVAYINSQVYVRAGGEVCALTTGNTVHGTIKANEAASVTVVLPASTLTHVLGSNMSGTAQFTGVIKLF